MKVEVSLYASLARYLPGGGKAGQPLIMELEEGATVEAVVSGLALPPEKVHLVFVNGIRSPLAARIRDRDRVGLFPAIAGG